MATKSTCDNCRDDFAFRVTVDMATAGGDRSKGKVPRFDCDLCQRCCDRVITAMKAIFPSTAIKE